MFLVAELLHIGINENSSIHYVFALNKTPVECINKLQKLPGFDVGLLLISYDNKTRGTACYVCDPSKLSTGFEGHDIIYCSFIRCLYKGLPLDFSINFREHILCFDYEKIDSALESYITSNL